MKVEKAQKCVKKINENIWKKSMKIYEKNLWKSIKPEILIKQKQVLLLQKTQKETQTQNTNFLFDFGHPLSLVTDVGSSCKD